MKAAASWLCLAALALTAPALADPRQDGGRGGGPSYQGGHDWRGGGGGGGRGDGGGRGEGGGRFDRGGGRWGDGAPGQGPGGPRGGRYDEGPPDGGRGGRFPGEGGLYAEPPRQPANSLGRDWRNQQNDVRQGVRSGHLKSLSEVLPELRRRTPGRQLDTGMESGADGRPTYRVRWAAENGRRMDFIVDARTGAILSVEGQ